MEKMKPFNSLIVLPFFGLETKTYLGYVFPFQRLKLSDEEIRALFRSSITPKMPTLPYSVNKDYRYLQVPYFAKDSILEEFWTKIFLS